MKINSGDIHTDVSEGVDELVFKVDDEDQGFIFEMLRSKIYSDSIAAICREIAANSRDANREVMKGHVPIEIGFRKEHLLDGGSSLHVYFKDEGPGISPDRMANVFCKYAKSTKRDTDEMTGGFGLGAKTPFAYTDAFNIETVVDRVKYLYTAYIDESRRGKIAKLSEEACEEPNGTTIVVPISPDDRRRFEQNIILYTCMWDVPPKYVDVNAWTGSEISKIIESDGIPKMKLEGGRVLYIVSRSLISIFDQGMGIIVDGMPYDLDTHQIPEYDGKNNYQLSSTTVVMRMETGEVDLSVNRETLQYTQKTIDAVSAIMKLVVTKMTSYLTEYVDDSTCYFEACTKAWSIFFDRDLIVPPNVSENDAEIAKTAMAWVRQYMSSGSIKELKYKGRDIVTSNPRLNHMYFRAGYVTSGGNVGYREMHFSFKGFSRRNVYLLDTKSKSAYRTKEAIQGTPNGEMVLICKREFMPDDKLSDVLNAANEIIFNDEVAADIKTLDDIEIPYKLYSSIPMPKRPSTATGMPRGKASATLQMSVKELKPDVNGGDCRKMFASKEIEVARKSGPVDEQHKTLYLVVSDMYSMPEFDRRTEAFAKFISLYYGMRMFVVSKRSAAHFADCLDVETAISALDSSVFQKIAKALAVMNTYDRAKQFGMYGGISLNADVMSDLAFLKRAYLLYKKTKLFARNGDFIDYRLPILLEHYKIGMTPYTGAASVFIDEFDSKYPLLSGDLRYVNRPADVELYIRLIDEHLEKIKNTKTK